MEKGARERENGKLAVNRADASRERIDRREGKGWWEKEERKAPCQVDTSFPGTSLDYRLKGDFDIEPFVRIWLNNQSTGQPPLFPLPFFTRSTVPPAFSVPICFIAPDTPARAGVVSVPIPFSPLPTCRPVSFPKRNIRVYTRPVLFRVIGKYRDPARIKRLARVSAVV